MKERQEVVFKMAFSVFQKFNFSQLSQQNNSNHSNFPTDLQKVIQLKWKMKKKNHISLLVEQHQKSQKTEFLFYFWPVGRLKDLIFSFFSLFGLKVRIMSLEIEVLWNKFEKLQL